MKDALTFHFRPLSSFERVMIGVTLALMGVVLIAA